MDGTLSLEHERALADAGSAELLGSRLVAQYEVARLLGFSDAELAELARGSVRASRAPAEVRETAYADIDTWLGSEPG